MAEADTLNVLERVPAIITKVQQEPTGLARRLRRLRRQRPRSVSSRLAPRDHLCYTVWPQSRPRPHVREKTLLGPGTFQCARATVAGAAHLLLISPLLRRFRPATDISAGLPRRY